MGSIIEINDTLQITREQGFPMQLQYEAHLKNPFTAGDFEGKIFEFKNKSGIRMYHTAPVRNFLVENQNGKWLYWGLIHIVRIEHDHAAKTTSGAFKIMYLYSPDEMKKAHGLIDRNPDTNFF